MANPKIDTNENADFDGVKIENELRILKNDDIIQHYVNLIGRFIGVKF